MITTVSLRSRLLVFITLPVLVVLALIGTGAFWASWKEIEEVYDAQLASSASVLLQLTQHELLDHDEKNIQLAGEDPRLEHKYTKKTAFRIWHDGKLFAESEYAKTFGELLFPPGFSNQKIRGRQWRVFVYVNPANGIRIETSERLEIRYELIQDLMVSLLFPALLLFPAVIGLVGFGVWQSLKPLLKLSAEVDRRSAQDFSPIQQGSIPKEVMAFVSALNRLLARLEESFARERDFTDNAAHELRTPLAAMKTQTQVLLKKAKGIPETKAGLENLHDSINRATHMVEQLLEAARLQHTEFETTSTDLTALVRRELEERQACVQAKNQTLDIRLAPRVKRDVHASSYSILFHNLLDNAVKYTPEGGHITVSLTAEGRLTLADTGPGLNDADKLRVLERFVRVDKTGQSGSGLGLAIVKAIAEAQHLSLTLADNTPHGLVVTVA